MSTIIQPVRVERISADGLTRDEWRAWIMGSCGDYCVRISHYRSERATRRHKWREAAYDSNAPQDVRRELARQLAEQMSAACGVEA